MVYQSGADAALVLAYGTLDGGDAPVVRVQSACAYGEVLMSRACDCRDQLAETYALFKNEGRGVLIYLDQEGRGAGLISKAKAYQVEEKLGLDTVEAYEHLGLPIDQRSYHMAGTVLVDLGILRLRLLTNNLRKLEQLRGFRLEVQRQPLQGPVSNDNCSYLMTKRTKLGHMLSLVPQDR